MGLIKKHGKDLAGKVFIFQSDFGWCIGKILRLQYHKYSEPWVTYKPLGQSKSLAVFMDVFESGTPMDLKSKLIAGSHRFEKYLELFSGIDQ